MTDQNPQNAPQGPQKPQEPQEPSPAEPSPRADVPFTASTTPPASPAYAAPLAPAGDAPVRWGGVVWGLLLTLFAGATLYVLASAERVRAAADWIAALTPGSAWALGAAVIGLVIVVSALLGGIRASQRRRVRTRI